MFKFNRALNIAILSLGAGASVFSSFSPTVHAAGSAPSDVPQGPKPGVVAAAPADRITAAKGGRPLGVAHPTSGSRTGLSTCCSQPSSGVLMSSHGGYIMPYNQTYAVYWQPSGWSFPINYVGYLQQYFTDVAAVSGATNDVYGAGTQYSQRNSDGTYSYVTTKSYFSGSTYLTAPFPASGCPVTSGYYVCLTQAQIQNYISWTMSQMGWTGGGTHLFFMFLPRWVRTCFDSTGSTGCSLDGGTKAFCAYHSWFQDPRGAGWVAYANQPYLGGSICDEGFYPNNNVADATINVVSHEHNEAITDPWGDGWYYLNMSGENGDLCSFYFGDYSTFGRTANGYYYNQVLNGHPYMLQMEYSNYSKGCVRSGW